MGRSTGSATQTWLESAGKEPASRKRTVDDADEAAATIRRWADAGAERIYLQVLDLADLDHLDLIATLLT